jgi:hypothetical protein
METPNRKEGRKDWRERRYVQTGYYNEACRFYKGRDMKNVGMGTRKTYMLYPGRPRR